MQRARAALETFEAVSRVVPEHRAIQAVRVEADVTVSSEYDDESSYFNSYALERFEVFDAEHRRIPLLDPSSGDEIERDELLEVPDAPVTLWLEVKDADAGTTGAA